MVKKPRWCNPCHLIIKLAPLHARCSIPHEVQVLRINILFCHFVSLLVDKENLLRQDKTPKHERQWLMTLNINHELLNTETKDSNVNKMSLSWKRKDHCLISDDVDSFLTYQPY